MMKKSTAVIDSAALNVLLPDPLLEFSHHQDARPTLVFRSAGLGEGDLTLALRLADEFFQALLTHPEPPQAMLFYHGGIRLTLENSPVIGAIRQLASRGCEVLVCRTSCEQLAPGSKPAAGQLADMLELTDRMRQAHKLLWP